MDFNAKVAGKAGLCGGAADALLVLVTGDQVAPTLEAPLAQALHAAVERGDFQFKAGALLVLHQVAGVKPARVLFAWVASSAPALLRKAAAAAAAALKSGGARSLAVALPDGADGGAWSADRAQAVCLALADATYLYRATKPSAGPDSKLQAVQLICATGEEKALSAALGSTKALASGIALARECANRPANHCTPRWLAEQARAMVKSHGLKVQVLDRKDCEKLGMGAFLAVAQGSEEPPRFIVMRWNGAAKSEAPLVLVGKGITFDTGGISIKPAAEMDEMKFDMGGAASVLGTLRAIAEAKARVNVIGLIPACENMPSGRAVKPGDVVTSLSGQTIEILNTDAEGRLILCDALTYAERFKPAAVVDIATLTGACVVALGHHRSGLFANDEALAAELLAAGEVALDPAWRMPLDDEYDEALKSHFADMANVGPRAGGAITAAMFLKRYTARLRWAHLDIAGTAWRSGTAKGATGRPVGLLVQWILGRAARVA